MVILPRVEERLMEGKRAMIRELEQENPLFRNIPVYLSRFGLRTWEQFPAE